MCVGRGGMGCMDVGVAVKRRDNKKKGGGGEVIIIGVHIKVFRDNNMCVILFILQRTSISNIYSI